MINYAILMFVFGITIILYGIGIYRGNKSLLPIRYHGKRTKEYLKYLGKNIIVVSISPILSGVSALLVQEDSIIPVIILIISMILCLIIFPKYFKE